MFRDYEYIHIIYRVAQHYEEVDIFDEGETREEQSIINVMRNLLFLHNVEQLY